MHDLPHTSILYADSARGIYIPQHFAESIIRDVVTGIDPEQYEVLENGPDHELYWEVWDEVEKSAVIAPPDTTMAYRLYHDGDLWLVPEDWTPAED